MKDLPSALSGIFSEALLIEDHEKREAFLKSACGGDTELLTETKELIKAHLDSLDAFSKPFSKIPEVSIIRNEHDSSETLSLPRAFGGYILEKVIGQGGMGIIYQATQTKLDRAVAIKMIRNAHFATHQEIKRFTIEAQSAASLDHPNIVPIFETGCIDGQHFLAMGLIEGVDLAEAIKNKLLSFEQSLYVIKKVAEAVNYAHHKGVIHRDLKPDNILLSKKEIGEDQTIYYEPRISDFGLAKRINQDQNLTLAGEIFGTPGYMSPEQATSQDGKVTTSTDIYSIGALLYFALSGHPPFAGETVWETLKQVKEAEPKRLRSNQPSIPKDLETICHKCLEKKPGDRYPSAENLLCDIANFEHNRPLLAKQTGSIARFIKLCQRHKIATLACTLGLLLLTTVIFFPLAFSSLLKEKDDHLKEVTSHIDKSLNALDQIKLTAGLDKALQFASSGELEHALEELAPVIKTAKSEGHTKIENLARYNTNSINSRIWKLQQNFVSERVINRFATSPDGEHLAIASDSNNLIIYDTLTEKVLLKTTTPSPITAICFHPSGKFLSTACKNKSVLFWKYQNQNYVADGELSTIRPKATASTDIHSIGFSIDGRSMFTASGDKSILLWDLSNRRASRALLEQENQILFAQSATQANRIISFDKKGQVYGWDMHLGKKRFGPVFLANDIKYGAIDSKGRQILVFFKNHVKPRIYDLSECNLETTSVKEFRQITFANTLVSVEFDNRSEKIITLGEKGQLHSLDIESLEPESLAIHSSDKISDFHFSNSTQKLFIQHTGDKNISIWNAPPSWNNRLNLPAIKKGSIAFTKDLKSVFSIDQNHISSHLAPSINSFDPYYLTKKKIKRSGTTTSILCDRKRNALFVLSKNGPADFEQIDTDTFKTLWSIKKLEHKPTVMRQSFDRKLLALLSENAQGDAKPNLTIIDLDTKAVSTHIIPSKNLRSLAFSSLNSSTLLSFSESDGLVWFDWETGQIAHSKTFGAKNVHSIDVSHAHEWVVIGQDDGVSRVYHERDWSPISPPIKHRGSVEIIRFADNGNVIVSCSEEQEATITDVATGRTIWPQMKHRGNIVTIQVFDDANTILTGSDDGVVKFWQIPKSKEPPLQFNVDP